MGHDLLLARVTLILAGVGGVLLGTALPSLPKAQAQTPSPQKIEADRLLKQGIEQRQTNNFEAAVQSCQQALLLYRELQDRQGEATTLGDCNLGKMYDFLSNYPKALEYHQQRLRVTQELKDQQGQGETLGDLGNVYRNLGNYAKALEYHEQHLAMTRQLKDRLGEGRALGNLGNDFYVLGQYDQAIQYHQQSLTIAREFQDRSYEAQALGSLAIAYFSLGQYDQAIQYHEQYLALSREIKDLWGERAALSNLASTYFSQRNYAKALEYYQQLLALARQLQDLLGERAALSGLGITSGALGNYPQAIEFLNQALTLDRQTKYVVGEAETLSNLGKAQFLAGATPKAEQSLYGAILLYESLREGLSNRDKVSIADAQTNAYNNLLQVLIAQDKVESALEISERNRTRAFVELLAQRVQSPAARPPDPISIAAIQKIAQTKQATLVHYSIIYEQFLFIWVVQPSGQVVFRQVDLTPLSTQNTTLENLINTARCLGSRSCEQYVAQQGTRTIAFNEARAEQVQRTSSPATIVAQNQSLQQLYRLLITPIADLLPEDANAPVLFVPQGPLFLVPFAALQNDQGTYLIEKHTILTAPSIQVLQLTQQQRQRVQQAQLHQNLVVGNPVMPSLLSADGTTRVSPSPLPGAEQEALKIAPLLNTQPLIGAQATEAEVVRRMPQSRLIHLATHGIFDSQEGLQSAIALAPSGDRLTPAPRGQASFTNGWLTASEILDLKLQAELVVLSACDTGRGRITGDGVIGLSRSFISAGVPSVLVSLWAVPDAPTAFLMTQFYQSLQQQPNKAKALRQAMLATKQQHSNPKDWAAFVLIGEAE